MSEKQMPQSPLPESPLDSLLLIGVGTSGCAAAGRIADTLPPGARVLLVDTDLSGNDRVHPFVLCGEGRLSGRGAGGSMAAGRAAFQDNPAILDPYLSGVRVACVVSCLGGGTGGGLAPEILKHLSKRGVTSLAIATLPFDAEGQERTRVSRMAKGLVAEYADTSVVLSMDELAPADLPMGEALGRALEKLASCASLLWRLAAKPGYIRLDPERLRNLLSDGGLARFGCATASGAGRVAAVLDALKLSQGRAVSTRVKTYFAGILAGDDLRLAEVGDIAGALAMQFGQEIPASIATVNDGEAFPGGEVSVVLLVFEEATRAVKKSNRRGGGNATTTAARDSSPSKDSEAPAAALAPGAALQDRFAADATVYDGENLDIPTYLRLNLTLD